MARAVLFSSCCFSPRALNQGSDGKMKTQGSIRQKPIFLMTSWDAQSAQSSHFLSSVSVAVQLFYTLTRDSGEAAWEPKHTSPQNHNSEGAKTQALQQDTLLWQVTLGIRRTGSHGMIDIESAIDGWCMVVYHGISGATSCTIQVAKKET